MQFYRKDAESNSAATNPADAQSGSAWAYGYRRPNPEQVARDEDKLTRGTAARVDADMGTTTADNGADRSAAAFATPELESDAAVNDPIVSQDATTALRDAAASRDDHDRTPAEHVTQSFASDNHPLEDPQFNEPDATASGTDALNGEILGPLPIPRTDRDPETGAWITQNVADDVEDVPLIDSVDGDEPTESKQASNSILQGVSARDHRDPAQPVIGSGYSASRRSPVFERVALRPPLAEPSTREHQRSTEQETSISAISADIDPGAPSSSFASMDDMHVTADQQRTEATDTSTSALMSSLSELPRPVPAAAPAGATETIDICQADKTPKPDQIAPIRFQASKISLASKVSPSAHKPISDESLPGDDPGFAWHTSNGQRIDIEAGEGNTPPVHVPVHVIASTEVGQARLHPRGRWARRAVLMALGAGVFMFFATGVDQWPTAEGARTPLDDVVNEQVRKSAEADALKRRIASFAHRDIGGANGHVAPQPGELAPPYLKMTPGPAGTTAESPQRAELAAVARALRAVEASDGTAGDSNAQTEAETNAGSAGHEHNSADQLAADQVIAPVARRAPIERRVARIAPGTVQRQIRTAAIGNPTSVINSNRTSQTKPLTTSGVSPLAKFSDVTSRTAAPSSSSSQGRRETTVSIPARRKTNTQVAALHVSEVPRLLAAPRLVGIKPAKTTSVAGVSPSLATKPRAARTAKTMVMPERNPRFVARTEIVTGHRLTSARLESKDDPLAERRPVGLQRVPRPVRAVRLNRSVPPAASLGRQRGLDRASSAVGARQSGGNAGGPIRGKSGGHILPASRSVARAPTTIVRRRSRGSSWIGQAFTSEK